MAKRVPSTKEQTLGERLRREAIESRPGFSEALHRRILCAVRQHHALEVSVGDRATMARRWRRGLTAVLAAACLFGAAAIGWRFIGSAQRHGEANDPQEIAGPSIEDLRVLDRWADQATMGLDDLVATATLKPQTAQLKHDARLAASTLLEPLPVDVQLVNDR